MGFSTTTPPGNAQTTGAPTASSSAELQTPPYFVARTRNGNLPVYSDLKGSGPGSRVSTIVRNVDGDLDALRVDLTEALFVDPSLPLDRQKQQLQGLTSQKGRRSDRPIFVKMEARQVVVNGDWTREIKSWLASKHF
ncbi:hypothetical protein OIO90_002862 [Microbotryomycetes sp. JL221]|nr:hypothetical protein OIO90_002862 [Microbotryomycetes sp. JL221]